MKIPQGVEEGMALCIPGKGMPSPEAGGVTIPPGTQPGAVLRLKGKDLPEFGNGRHGELYLRIEVRVPERLSREERELYERLRALGGKQGFFSKIWK